MSLFSDSISYGANTVAMQGGDLSFGQKAGAAVAGAVVSGLGSIYNTFASGANFLGADIKDIDTYKVLHDLDTNWGSYYEENKHAIDTAGFVAGSLIPGNLAVWGLKAARAGMTEGAIGNALNFTRNKQLVALDAGLKELAVEGGTAFSRINKYKMQAIGWEVADQVINAAAFETAVAATMKQSPLLADDGWWDTAKNIMVGTALGGGIGGVIGGLGLNAAFKGAVKTVDTASNKYTAISGLDKLGVTPGDRAFGLIEAISGLPGAVLETDAKAVFKFPVIGGPKEFNLDISQALTTAMKSSEKTALENFTIKVKDIAGAGTDDATAAAFGNFLVQRFQELKASGASPQQLREGIGDYILNLNRVTGATHDSAIPRSEMFYFSKAVDAEVLAKIETVPQLRSVLINNAPLPGGTAYKKPHVFTGSKEEFEALQLVRVGTDEFPTLSDAWKAGHLIAIDKNNGVRINYQSGKWREVDDPVYSLKQYLNTRTGAITDDTLLLAADKLPAGSKFHILEDSIEIPQKDAKTVRLDMTSFKPDQSVGWVTARHAWASGIAVETLEGVTEATIAKRLSGIPTVTDIRDISLIDRLAELPEVARKGRVIKMLDGTLEDAVDIQKISQRARIDGIMDALNTGTQDVRELAARFNTTEKWVEDLIAKEFGTAGKPITTDGMRRPLESYKQRENVVLHFDTPFQFGELKALSALSSEDKVKAILADARNTGGQFLTGELAYQYRVQQAVLANDTASAAVLGAARHGLLPDLATDIARTADSTGTGATILGAANANYGDRLRLVGQQIGKLVNGWHLKSNSMVVDALSSVSRQIISKPEAAAEVGIVTNILRNEPGKFVVDSSKPGTLIRRELAIAADAEEYGSRLRQLQAAGERTHINFQYPEAFDYMSASQSLNAERIEKGKVLWAARGRETNRDSAVWYVPPVDTNYFQHFVFVKAIEGRAFSSSEVAMVFGRNAEELAQRVAHIDRNKFEVISKDGSERYHKALGDYNFDQTINERMIDSELRRSGALANFYPETRAANIIEDYTRWNQNQELRLLRNAVESKYAQQIEELRALGRNFVEDATSKFSGTLKASRSEVTNPFEDYVKTMLDVSKRSEYRFFHEANEFVDALGTRAYQILADVTGEARKGTVSYQDANAIMRKHGIEGHYSSELEYFQANAPRDKNLIKNTIAKANTLLANLVLRFDVAQSMMNVISTPLLLSTELASIKSLASKNPELIGELEQLYRVKVPGQELTVPSAFKLQLNAVQNYFGPDREQLIRRYFANQDVKDTLLLHHATLQDLQLSPNFQAFSTGVDNAVEKVATLTGNNWAEKFTRFVTADTMRQLTEPLVRAGVIDEKIANSYIGTFVNRVQGNYVSSQRPIIFQGVLGGAVSLFQTYSFNLLQQLLRHVENKDTRAVATMFGMQAGLFGLNGTPAFDAINSHLIGTAATNPYHHDSYSVVPSLLGHEVGNWLMYGTASAMPLLMGGNNPAFYTRGDINPRHASVIPVTPQDVPAVDASIRFVSNLLDVGKKLVQGADVSETLLQGLEHNGLNRPLAGVAQVLAGHTTTSKGSLISASNDFSLVATAGRIAGAKTMDESVALNALFRSKAYAAASNERMETLGEVVKSRLIKNQAPSDEELMTFMENYAKIGGRAENFNAALQRWSKDANQSVVEKIRSNLNSPQGLRLAEIMGSGILPDYRQLQTAPDAQSQQ